MREYVCVNPARGVAPVIVKEIPAELEGQERKDFTKEAYINVYTHIHDIAVDVPFVAQISDDGSLGFVGWSETYIEELKAEL